MSAYIFSIASKGSSKASTSITAIAVALRGSRSKKESSPITSLIFTFATSKVVVPFLLRIETTPFLIMKIEVDGSPSLNRVSPARKVLVTGGILKRVPKLFYKYNRHNFPERWARDTLFGSKKWCSLFSNFL